MTATLLSICLPIFSGNRLSDASLQSLLNQSSAEYELVIGCEPSNEQTITTVQRLQETDPRVKLILLNGKPNVWAALNQCFSAAKGKLIKPLAADIILPPEFLERAIQLMIGNESIAVISGCLGDDCSLSRSAQTAVNPFAALADCVTPGKIIARKVLQSVGDLVIKPESLLFRASSETLFDETLNAFAGTDFLLRLLGKGNFYLMSGFKINSQSATAMQTYSSECDLAVEVIKLAKRHNSLLEQVGMSKEDLIDRNLEQIGHRLIGSWNASKMPNLTTSSFGQNLPASEDLARQLVEYKELSIHFLLLLAKNQIQTENEERSQIKLLEDRLQAILRSKSWKYTKVLREANIHTKLGTNVRQLFSKGFSVTTNSDLDRSSSRPNGIYGFDKQ